MLISAKFTVRVRTEDRLYAGTDSDIRVTVYLNSGRSIYLGSLNNRYRNDLERGQLDTFYYAGNYVSSVSDYANCVKLETCGSDSYLMEWMEVEVRGYSKYFWNRHDKKLSKNGREGYSSYKLC